MPRLASIGLVTACVLLSSSSAAASTPTRATACADVVRYGGKLYDGTFVGRAQRRGARIRVVRPGCNDTGGANEPDIAITATKIVGVSPTLAVLAVDNARHVYLVSGVFPEYPDHPLHIALYGNRARPNECAGARVVGAVRIRGSVTETPLAFDLLSVRTASRQTSLLRIDAWTRLAYPYTLPLVKGNRVDIVATRCRKPNTTAALVVARRIALRR